MDINNKARIHWACRRGMRELDISIMPFFEYEYDSLSDDDKRLFVRLLESDDGAINSNTESGTWSCGNLIFASRGARSGCR